MLGIGLSLTSQALIMILQTTIIMALQGLFNAGYSAAFSVVSRKILYQVRVLLFSQIVDQDVAFFDGMKMGCTKPRPTSSRT